MVDWHFGLNGSDFEPQCQYDHMVSQHAHSMFFESLDDFAGWNSRRRQSGDVSHVYDDVAELLRRCCGHRSTAHPQRLQIWTQLGPCRWVRPEAPEHEKALLRVSGRVGADGVDYQHALHGDERLCSSEQSPHPLGLGKKRRTLEAARGLRRSSHGLSLIHI